MFFAFYPYFINEANSDLEKIEKFKTHFVVAIVSAIATIVHAAKSFFEFDSKSSASLNVSNKNFSRKEILFTNIFLNYFPVPKEEILEV